MKTMPRLGNQDRVVIAVMGPTGVGKTTFVNALSGENLPTSLGLRSCTSGVNCTKPFHLYGRQIILIDTPGFDDTTASNAEIVRIICLSFATLYRQGVLLSGILYLHRISDMRAFGSTRRSLSIFRKLCGDAKLCNVAVLTTMWGEVPHAVAERREQQLATDELLFKPLLDGGAQMFRDNGPTSSPEAVLHIMGSRPAPLLIQEELVDENKPLEDTSVGKELREDLDTLVRRHQDELEDIRQEMAAAVAERDEVARLELEEIKAEIDCKVREVLHDRDSLSQEYVASRRLVDEAIKSLSDQIENEERERQRVELELSELVERARKQGSQDWIALRRRLNELDRPRRSIVAVILDAIGDLFDGRY